MWPETGPYWTSFPSRSLSLNFFALSQHVSSPPLSSAHLLFFLVSFLPVTLSLHLLPSPPLLISLPFSFSPFPTPLPFFFPLHSALLFLFPLSFSPSLPFPHISPSPFLNLSGCRSSISFPGHLSVMFSSKPSSSFPLLQCVCLFLSVCFFLPCLLPPPSISFLPPLETPPL